MLQRSFLFDVKQPVIFLFACLHLTLTLCQLCSNLVLLVSKCLCIALSHLQLPLHSLKFGFLGLQSFRQLSLEVVHLLYKFLVQSCLGSKGGLVLN